MSKAAHSTQPNLSCMIPAVEDNGTSGDDVAKISKSISSGFKFASSRACLHASTAKSDVHISELAILLFFIPVFVVIHSSLVSTYSIQSSLLISLGGTYAPKPIIPTDTILSPLAK